MKSEVMDAITSELSANGIRYTAGCTRKHRFVEFELRGSVQRYVYSASPSDWRAPRKARSDIRRMLRGE